MKPYTFAFHRRLAVAILMVGLFSVGVLSSCRTDSPDAPNTTESATESNVPDTSACTETDAPPTVTLPADSSPDATETEETESDGTAPAEPTPGVTLPAETEPRETTPADDAPDGVVDWSTLLPAVTLPPQETEAPAETLPPPGADALDPDTDYTALVITAYYATGNGVGEAMADASFVEIYNTSDTDLSLGGVSLYVSNRGGAFEEYPFYEADIVPAGGAFLVRGRDAAGESADALTVGQYDRLHATLSPDPKNTRLVLAAAERTLPADRPLADITDIFSAVSSHAMDAADVYRYIAKPSADELVRKKASTHKTDYQTVDLTDSSAAVLSLIRPRTSAGDVNTEVHPVRTEVIFSHPSGIYAEGFDLTLSAPEGYEIYYTVNNSDPRTTAPLRYYSALHLQDTTTMTLGRLTNTAGVCMGTNYDPLVSTFPGAAVIKAFARNPETGDTTPLVIRTYFIGAVFSDWEVDLVSLSVNEADFLGGKGIYNNIKQGVGAVREHIAAYVEFISPEGDAVHTGWCEIAMNGKGSLGMTQKSFRILLKSTPMNSEGIGENLSTMDYDLFGEYASKTPDGESVTWFRHILLRNGGGDMSGSTISRSHIGDAYIQRLDRYLAPDVMAYAPTMVYINGEFWGMYNARERLDSKYFMNQYSIAEEDLAVVECPYPIFYGWNVDYTEGLDDPTEIADATDFMDVVRFCQNNDLSNDANYQYVADRVDIDGLIDFYCAQIYLNCSDWPSNNIKVWRNKNPDNPNVDTRWHFCIVDTDHGVGLNSTVETNLWGVISDGPVLSRIINHLLQNATFRERFLMRYTWCIEVYFTPERMKAELDSLVEPILPIMQYQLDRWRCTNGERTDWDTWYSYIEVIRDYADNRPAYAKSQFMQWAGIDESTYQQLKTKAISEWGSSAAPQS